MKREGGVGFIHIFAGSQRVVSINTSNNTEQYYHPNHLGSAAVMTDINGNLTETIEYYPYGTYRGSNQNPAAHYTFTGQEDDHELGLYNYKARLYDPLLGRFTTPDSIVPSPGNPQSLNRYSYCLNNPLVYTDPSGHGFFSSIGHIFSQIAREVTRFVHNYGADIVAGAVGAAVFVLSGGTAAPIFAGIMGGMAAGATGAALNGAPLSGILQAAAMGGAFGAIGGGLYAAHVPGLVLLAAGAGASYATGGVEGLEHFGAGLAGAMAGGYAAGYAKQNWGRWFPDANPSQAQPIRATSTNLDYLNDAYKEQGWGEVEPAGSKLDAPPKDFSWKSSDPTLKINPDNLGSPLSKGLEIPAGTPWYKAFGMAVMYVLGGGLKTFFLPVTFDPEAQRQALTGENQMQ